MSFEQFRHWYDFRHTYQKEWKARTGRQVVGYFCTYCPEEIFYAFDLLPVRIMGTHEPQEITDPHIYPMFCPYCRDVLAQGLNGKYSHLDGIMISQSCIHMRQAFGSWEIHRNPGFSHYLPMPNHVQSPRAVPFLKEEYCLLIKKLASLTGRAVTAEDLERGISLMNQVRATLKQVYELRKDPHPPITGAQAMLMACASFFTHARDWLKAARDVLADLQALPRQREAGKRLILVGSENDDLAFIEMVEEMDSAVPGIPAATVVVEEHCATTRYFWNQTRSRTKDPLAAIAERYCSRTPCPSKDWPQRSRIPKIIGFARAFNCDGAVIVQQKFCDPHQADMPFVKQALENEGIPTCFLEFDTATPLGAFSMKLSDFFERLDAPAGPEDRSKGTSWPTGVPVPALGGVT